MMYLKASVYMPSSMIGFSSDHRKPSTELRYLSLRSFKTRFLIRSRYESSSRSLSIASRTKRTLYYGVNEGPRRVAEVPRRLAGIEAEVLVHAVRHLRRKMPVPGP